MNEISAPLITLPLPFVIEGVSSNWTPGKWREELWLRFNVVETSPGVWEDLDDEPIS